MAEVLLKNKTLRSVVLEGNNIGTEGMMYVLKALETNTSVIAFTLTNNGCLSRDSKRIATMLNKNRTLTTLGLHYLLCGTLKFRGAKRITDALKSNSTLRTLNLCDSSITPNAEKILKRTSEEIPTLEIRFTKEETPTSSADTSRIKLKLPL